MVTAEGWGSITRTGHVQSPEPVISGLSRRFVTAIGSGDDENEARSRIATPEIASPPVVNETESGND